MNNQYQDWSMEVLKVLGLKNFRYETGIKTPQSRRNLQASRLKWLNTAACPPPLLRTTHRLKNIVKSEHKSLVPEACFPLPHQGGVLMGSKVTIGCLGKPKMWFSIKTYKLLKYCYRSIFQFQLQFSLWYNYIHTNQTASVQFSMTYIIWFWTSMARIDGVLHIKIKRLSKLFR